MVEESLSERHEDSLSTQREAWLETYSVLYGRLPDTGSVPCPHCGSSTLRLRFIRSGRGRRGSAIIWCETCRTGMGISRVPLPAKATDLVWEDWQQAVANLADLHLL